MSVQNLTPGVKPTPWIVQRDFIAPEWNWFWNSNELPFVLPFWSGKIDEPDIISRIRPVKSGSGFSYEPAHHGGGTVKSTGSSRLRYVVGSNNVEFNTGDRWTYLTGFQMNDTTADERTIFGKVQDGSASNRQLFARTTIATPAAIEIRQAGVTVFMTTSASIVVGTPYLLALTNDASAADNLTAYVIELFTGVIIVDGQTATFDSDVTADTELQLFSHFSDTNDDMDGELSFAYYLSGIVAQRSQVLDIARDPYGPIRPAFRVTGRVPAVGGFFTRRYYDELLAGHAA